MGRIGQFDTDTQALKARIDAHAAYGARNLEDWVFEQLGTQQGHRVLDLGSGMGKQSLPLARLVGPRGHVTAVDIAAESLAVLEQQAAASGVADRITTRCAPLDAVDDYLDPEALFDRVVACYSIYYANQPRKVFTRIHGALAPAGRFFFCGPASTNNSELKAFHYSVSGEPPPAGAAPFMEGEGQTLARELFGAIEVTTFENPLIFNSADALLKYWRSYNLYDAQLDARFQEAARAHFTDRETFTTCKRVLGVLGVK